MHHSNIFLTLRLDTNFVQIGIAIFINYFSAEYLSVYHKTFSDKAIQIAAYWKGEEIQRPTRHEEGFISNDEKISLGLLKHSN